MAEKELSILVRARGAIQASRDIGKVDSAVGRLGRTASTGLKTAGANLASFGILAGGAAAAGLTVSIRAATDLAESLSKVNVVFGESAAGVVAWSEKSASALGQTQQQALEAAGTYGNLFQAFGVGRTQATEMSTSLVELAADLASFNNTSVDDALIALRSGLSGETEPLKRFGVALSVDRMKTEALRLGIIKTTKTAMTPAQKAMAAYAIIMHDTTLAQGDFVRTSGGLANQQRILQANMHNAAATIGTALLPKITELAVSFNELLAKPATQAAIKNFAASLPKAFDSALVFAKQIPWSTIADSLRVGAAGARAVLDVFTSMPPWVQTAVITGWGLNKLTGGAAGSLIGQLGSGLIKGVLGMNAGVVNINAGVVNSGGLPGGKGVPPVAGAPTAAAVAGFLAPGLGTAVAGALTPFLMFNVIPRLVSAPGGDELKPGQKLGLTPTANQTMVSVGLGNALAEAARKQGGDKAPTFIDDKWRSANAAARLGNRDRAERAGLEADVLERATDKGMKPSAAAITRTADRTAARQEAATRAAASQTLSGWATGVGQIVTAIKGINIPMPKVNINVTSTDVQRATARRKRIAKPAGSRGALFEQYG